MIKEKEGFLYEKEKFSFVNIGINRNRSTLSKHWNLQARDGAFLLGVRTPHVERTNGGIDWYAAASSCGKLFWLAIPNLTVAEQHKDRRVWTWPLDRIE